MANEKRLIDANVVEKVMNDRYKALAAEYGHYDHYTTGYGDALCVVEDAPTVDAVEVVHGRWVQRLLTGKHGSATCSECNTTWDAESNYCPNCGAKMDGDKNDS